MQNLFEGLFLLALFVPPALVVIMAGTLVVSSFVYWRAHAGEPSAGRGAMALHHPVGR